MQRLVEANTEESHVALIDLLQKENRISTEAYLKAGSVDAVYGEDYSEYTGALGGVVFDLASTPRWEKRAVPVMAEGGYEPDGFLAAWLATKPTLVLPVLETLIQARADVDRASAVGIAGEIVRLSALGFATTARKDVARARSILDRGADDPDFTVRQAAVDSLAKLNDSRARMLLARVAASDAYFDQESHTYPLRVAAKEAIEHPHPRLAPAVTSAR